MWISGVIIFLCPFTFLCLLFPFLKLGPMPPGLLPWDVLLDLITKKASSLKGANIHGFDGRMTHGLNHTVINATPSNSLRESISAVRI